MYSVTEVSKLIGVSRQSIYKKTYKEGLQEYLINGDEGKEVTQEGFELLKNFLMNILKVNQRVLTYSQATVRQQTPYKIN